MPLRPYQQQAADSAIRSLAVKDEAGALVVMPTGTGKTHMFADVVRRWHAGTGKAVMVMAHRAELIEQARAKLIQTAEFAGWQVGIEMGTSRASQHQPVTVASVQTLRGKRLERWCPEHFGLIVVDEAHHSPAAGYRRVFDHFDTAKRLGVTATPDRLDGKGLGSLFDGIAYQYALRDAITDGYLVPIRCRSVRVGLDLSRVKKSKGDFHQGQLARTMETSTLVEEIVQPTIELAGDRPTIVFATGLRHAELLAESFNRHRSGSARWIQGGQSREIQAHRRKALADFQAGKFQYLCNVEILTEGVDLPNAACVAMARPTMSWALYMQMLGRGTRLLGPTLDESIAAGKPNLLVLDFAGNTGKHPPVRAIDALIPDLSDAAKAKVAARLDDEADPWGLASDAEAELQRELDLIAEQEREAREAASRRRVEYQAGHEFDLLNLGAESGPPAPDWLVENLAQAGIPHADRLSLHQAEQALMVIQERKRKYLCTYKQGRQLKRYGLDPNMKYRKARKVMDALASAGWPTPGTPRAVQVVEQFGRAAA